MRTPSSCCRWSVSVQSFVSEHYVVSQPYHALSPRRCRRVYGRREPTDAPTNLWPGGYRRCGRTRRIRVDHGHDALFVLDWIATTDRSASASSSTVTFVAAPSASGVERCVADRVHSRRVRDRTSGHHYGTAAERVATRVMLAILMISGLGCLTFYEIGWVGIPQRIQLVVIAAGTFGAAVRSLHMHHPFSRFLNARK